MTIHAGSEQVFIRVKPCLRESRRAAMACLSFWLVSLSYWFWPLLSLCSSCIEKERTRAEVRPVNPAKKGSLRGMPDGPASGTLTVFKSEPSIGPQSVLQTGLRREPSVERTAVFR